MNIFSILQTIVAVILIVVILLQSKSAGAGSMFGGGGDAVFNEKRGIDKKLHQVTIVLAIIFMGLAVANLVL